MKCIFVLSLRHVPSECCIFFLKSGCQARPGAVDVRCVSDSVRDSPTPVGGARRGRVRRNQVHPQGSSRLPQHWAVTPVFYEPAETYLILQGFFEHVLFLL